MRPAGEVENQAGLQSAAGHRTHAAFSEKMSGFYPMNISMLQFFSINLWSPRPPRGATVAAGVAIGV